MDFQRPEHRLVARALASMNTALLADARCWFAGGTAIVLLHGEYRRSLDIDFLCADAEGYRRLRSAAVELGAEAFFSAPVKPLREMRIDQYGLRTFVEIEGQPLKFEIIREARISLTGAMHKDLGIPILSAADMVAEKLLANADRCQDRSIACRDAFDLGILIQALGQLPTQSVEKAVEAYGADIARKIRWVVEHLADIDGLHKAASTLQMNLDLAEQAIQALRDEADRLWP